MGKMITKYLFLFSVGGFIYNIIETLFRGYTHWTMFLLGGVCFVVIGVINEYVSWDLGMIWQSLMGATIITTLEFVTGVVVNIWLKMEIWDYSNTPLNIMGQVCLPFFLLWILVAGVAIIMDDYIRYWMFGEEKPKYKLI